MPNLKTKKSNPPPRKPARRAAPTPIALAPPPTSYTLTEVQQKDLRESNNVLAQAKMSFANFCLEVETQKAQHLAAVATAAEGVKASLTAITKEFKIPEDGSQKWDIDPDTMVMTRKS